MTNVKVDRLRIAGALLIEPPVHKDMRGSFTEMFNATAFTYATGLTNSFVQDNVIVSAWGVLRGLHVQVGRTQGKLVSCLHGRVLDLLVDCRDDSPTFGEVDIIVLDGRVSRSVWVPPGVAHGVFSQTTDSVVLYKSTTHHGNYEEKVLDYRYLGGRLPFEPMTVSGKDRDGLSLEALKGIV